jgi:hypothetical protein
LTKEENKVAAAILQHIAKNPQAKHDVKGIATYWVFQQNLEANVDLVMAAVDFLTEKRFLLEVQNLDGSAYYKLNPDNMEEIDSFIIDKKK